MVTTTRRFLCAADNHGDKADPSAVEAFFAFRDYFKPDDVFHLGDCFDWRPFRNGASRTELNEGIADDTSAGLEFMRRLNPDVWVMGNHDHRLPREVERCENRTLGLLLGNEWDAICKECANIDISIVPWGKRNFLQHGDHKLIHGYHSGLYAARQAAAVYGNVIMGHVHTSDMHRSPHIDGAAGHTSACLCELDMEYNKGHPNTLKQQNGWVYGFNHHGRLAVFHAVKTGDTWYLPTEFKEVPCEQ